MGGEAQGALDSTRLLAVVRVQQEIAASARDTDAVMEVVATRARELTRADASVVELLEEDESVCRGASGTARRHLGLRLSRSASLSGRSMFEQRVLVCDDAETDDRVDREAARAVGARSLVCVPLSHRGVVTGVLKVYAGRPAAFAPTDVAVLGLLGGAIAAHLSHAAELERRTYESRHDALTDLGNRRAYDERLVKEVARARRYDRPLSLAHLDLDGFKAVNDRDGHPAGDEVLRRVAALLRSTRSADECFRLGGDEFALLLPDTTMGGAERVAARIARRLADAGLSDGLSVSFGAAECREDGAEALHAAADARLLAAKGALSRRR